MRVFKTCFNTLAATLEDDSKKLEGQKDDLLSKMIDIIKKL